MDADLIIVGGSVRAAAASARRAGLRPWCADLYGDLDTVALSCGPPARIRHYSELPALFTTTPNVPWIYTGCLENRPGLIARLARLRPLWGNAAAALAACRSPARVAEVLRRAGLPALEVRDNAGDLTADRLWVQKSLRSCGGQGVRLVQRPPARLAAGGQYFQEFAAGTPMSAVFVADDAQTRLLGVTEQLVHPDGIDWLNAGPFAYAGSMGPVPLSDRRDRDLRQIGEVLHRACGLRGLFGVDFVCCHDGPRVVEVNPRYTASIEVLERSIGLSALALHRQAFDQTAVPRPARSSGPACVGKAVVFNPRKARVRYSNDFAANLIESCAAGVKNAEPLCYADLPADGSAVPRGAPVMTVFAGAPDRNRCETMLRDMARRVLRQLAPDRG